MSAVPDHNDLEELKRATPPRVLVALADALGMEGDGRGTYRCPDPAHPDDHPSAGVVPSTLPPRGHGVMICGACKVPNDAIALVQYASGLDFLEARKWLARWLAHDAPALRSTGVAEKPPFDPTVVRQAWRNRDLALELTADLLDDIGVAANPDAVRKRWRLGAVQEGRKDYLVMPYLRRAGGSGEEGRGSGRLVAVHAKRRERKEDECTDGVWSYVWKKRWCSGSVPEDGLLFGEHLLADQRTVVLCEGETDVLALSWWLRKGSTRAKVLGSAERALVLGWHDAGAHATDRLVGLLAGRSVVLVPDPDGAGQACAQRWSAALARASRKRCSVAALPPGRDAVAAGEGDVLRALRRAARDRPAAKAPRPAMQTGRGAVTAARGREPGPRN